MPGVSIYDHPGPDPLLSDPGVDYVHVKLSIIRRLPVKKEVSDQCFASANFFFYE